MRRGSGTPPHRHASLQPCAKAQAHELRMTRIAECGIVSEASGRCLPNTETYRPLPTLGTAPSEIPPNPIPHTSMRTKQHEKYNMRKENEHVCKNTTTHVRRASVQPTRANVTRKHIKNGTHVTIKTQENREMQVVAHGDRQKQQQQ